MNTSSLAEFGQKLLETYFKKPSMADKVFSNRFLDKLSQIESLFDHIYSQHPSRNNAFDGLLTTLIKQHKSRSSLFLKKDATKTKKGNWFLSNEITGMSLYVDRFAGDLKGLADKLGYFHELGVNFLHLMPVFESPINESDGGYAVSNFKKVAAQFGENSDLHALIKRMNEQRMYLMLDIVFSHTSNQHEWALKAKAGNPYYQDFFYFYDDRSLPDQFDQTMPEVFPDHTPGNFTFIPECNKWVMTVFHRYQWDLNYSNPELLVAMLDNILFYANMGVDVLRLDAPAFIWKQPGTTSQNLPKAHMLLSLIKQCVSVVSPGMALLGEAIVAPEEILKYFGTQQAIGSECDLAYNATQMALQWDALATGDTSVMIAGQQVISQKPIGCSWISYTRCHDDIGLGYDDYMIAQAGFNPFHHRSFLKNHYAGWHENSMAKGALFSVNHKTNDARISGSLASLCGLEKAIELSNQDEIELALKKIILMQAHSLFMGGIPMLFYGDEMGYTNDYSYLKDEGKSYDNRWMHRPLIDWKRNEKRLDPATLEGRIFGDTQKLITLRKELSILSDHNNVIWMTPHNVHMAGFIRTEEDKKLYCLFNYAASASYLTWYAFKEFGAQPTHLKDLWTGQKHKVGKDQEHFILPSFGFALLEMAD
jgi:amylosucrase